MLSRKFTSREKVLLVIFAILLLGVFYYQGVIRTVDDMKVQYDTIDLEDQIAMEQTKALSRQQMETEMSGGNLTVTGMVASYDNIKQEISALNEIFADAASYNLSFAQPVKEGSAVRRDISVTFHANSYNTAVSIIRDLHNCRYRCLIKDITFSSGEGIRAGSEVDVSLGVTFFETMYNANTTTGLAEAAE
ncbi:MAG TPA: hypothetical protein VJY37_01880 [Anaerovoracaceae bacterium]|nr:hypothetical protein [Anaerovoracaceae bacterium]